MKLLLAKIISILKPIVPCSVIHWCKDLVYKRKLLQAYLYDMRRFHQYGDCFTRFHEDNEGDIIKTYHIVEKGLTMPETRLGFGRAMILRLAELTHRYITEVNPDNDQVLHAAKVLLEYQEFHQANAYELDEEVQSAIEKVVSLVEALESSKQLVLTADEYLQKTSASFDDFAHSRHSLRNFSDQPLGMDQIEKALDLARTAPSACNRQCWRTHVYTDKEQIQAILDIQGGSRGFGHLADKLIVMTGTVGVFADVFERNQAFIDGGLYAMNLLYALHYHKIGACILNCSHTPEKDRRLRQATDVNEDEVFIAMIACGHPASDLKIAASPRKPVAATNTIV